jgi:hypothetical protein
MYGSLHHAKDHTKDHATELRKMNSQLLVLGECEERSQTVSFGRETCSYLKSLMDLPHILSGCPPTMMRKSALLGPWTHASFDCCPERRWDRPFDKVHDGSVRVHHDFDTVANMKYV